MIHFYRHLINEENDEDGVKRICCIVSYLSTISYKYFHNQSNVSYYSHHKIISLKIKKPSDSSTLQRTFTRTVSILLVILAWPHVIIALVSKKCMKSTSNSWLFCFRYFI